MPTQTEKTFIQWLGIVLGDERWRAIVRGQMQQHELSVIQLGAAIRRPAGRHPRESLRRSELGKTLLVGVAQLERGRTVSANEFVRELEVHRRTNRSARDA